VTLKRINLDNEGYTQLVAAARESIAEYCPQWTDYNTHDPGITLIELFAHLTEMQRYFANKSEAASALLRLLGIELRRATPSRVYVRIVRSEEGFSVPVGTPLFAEDIRFETVHPLAFGARHQLLELVSDELGVKVAELTLFAPFGVAPAPGRRFSLFLETPPQPGKVLSLEVALFYPEDFVRNAIDAVHPPRFAELLWEQRVEDGYYPLEAQDSTYGFITDGVVRLSFSKPLAPDEQGRYEIRCTLLSCDYDLAPCIMSLQPSVFVAQQCHTVSEEIDCGSNPAQLAPNTWLASQGEQLLFYEQGQRYTRIQGYEEDASSASGLPVFSIPPECLPPEAQSATAEGRFRLISCMPQDAHRRVLGEAWGFPHARFVVACDGQIILRERFVLLVADSPELACAQRWTLTDNLYVSRPNDTHYLLDEDTGVVSFGDGVHGAMPTGLVFVASLVLTRGVQGNITSNQLNTISFGERSLVLAQTLPSEGGSDTENAQKAIRRSQTTLSHAVTARDVESLVQGIPGLAIRRVRAYRKATASCCDATGAPLAHLLAAPTVLIAVQPMGAGRPLLTATSMRYIRDYLEPYRLAGTEFEVVGVRYARMDVTAELHTRIPGEAARLAIEAVIRSFAEDRADFGAHLEQAELVLRLEALPEVEQVHSVELRTTSGYARRSSSGSISLDESAVIALGTLTVLFG
jgi:hypothetical protein